MLAPHPCLGIIYLASFQENDYVELPRFLRRNRNLLNIKNKDCASILYCIAAAVRRNKNKVRNRTRSSWYNTSLLEYKDVSFPTYIDDIPLLEDLNRVKIDVYSLNGTSFKNIYKSEKLIFKASLNLLLLNADVCPHYVLIEDISKLVSSKKVKSKYCSTCKCFDDIKHDHDVVKLDDIPQELIEKHGLIHIKSNDNNLLPSIVISLRPKYHYENRLITDFNEYAEEFESFKFPSIKGLEIFKAVRLIVDTCLININIFLYEDGEFLPYFVPKTLHNEFVDLVLLEDRQTFLIIKSLSALYRKRSDNHHYVCRRCLEICLRQNSFTRHLEYCQNHEIQRVEMSDKKILKFTNIRKQYPMLFVVYADFEAMIKGSEHVPISVAWKMVSNQTVESTDVCVYTGLDCVTVFIDALLELYDSIKHYFTIHEPMNLTEDEEAEFISAAFCHICCKPFNAPIEKVRDHDHITGEFLDIYIIPFIHQLI